MVSAVSLALTLSI